MALSKASEAMLKHRYQNVFYITFVSKASEAMLKPHPVASKAMLKPHPVASEAMLNRTVRHQWRSVKKIVLFFVKNGRPVQARQSLARF